MSRVLVLGMGLGSEPIVASLLEHGVELVVMDKDPMITQDLKERFTSSGQLTVIDSDFSQEVAIHQVVQSYGITHTLALPVGRSLTHLGKINDTFGFAGPSFQAIDTCTDKRKFHLFLRQHQIPDYDFMLLEAEDLKDLSKASAVAQKLSFPLILKPTQGSGSAGVRVVFSLEELLAYQIPERFADAPILAEQMLEGTEYSLNVFVDAGGQVHLICLLKKEISNLPYRQEAAYFVDPENFKAAQLHILPLIQKITAALSLKSSFIHADCILTPDQQAYVVDISPRLAGNLVFLLENFLGSSPVELFMSEVLHDTSKCDANKDDSHKRAHLYAVLRFFSFQEEGTVTAFEDQLTSPEEKAAIVSCANNLKIGTKVGPLKCGAQIEAGHIMIKAKSLNEANALTLKYLSGFKLHTEERSLQDVKSPVSYEEFHVCPLCGSSDFIRLHKQKQVMQATPLRSEERKENAIIQFTPVICCHCGLSYNAVGLSAQARNLISTNYHFIKPSSGVGSANYQSYIQVVRDSLDRLAINQTGSKKQDLSVVEIGGYDGYLLRELAASGYRDLTLIDPSPQMDASEQEHYSIKVFKDCWSSKMVEKNQLTERFDVIATKDTIQVVPQLVDFISAMVLALRAGGILVLSSNMVGLTALQWFL